MTPDPLTLQAAREQAIDALCRRFADDTISLPELERRLEKARQARTREELRSLLSDLPAATSVPARPGETERRSAAGGTVASRRPASRVDRPPVGREGATSARRRGGEVRTSSSVALAVMGGTKRAGKWVPPENMLALAVMGGVELDFREAVLEPGSITTINCFTFWGGIDITVPPDVYVEVGGFALMGGFDQKGEVWPDLPEDAPVIEVNGFALMGGVEVRIRARGEDRPSARSQRELRRESRRELRRGRGEGS
jgi:hypothetical protein